MQSFLLCLMGSTHKKYSLKTITARPKLLTSNETDVFVQNNISLNLATSIRQEDSYKQELTNSKALVVLLSTDSLRL